MKALLIDNVSKNFGGLQVLRDILIELEKGTRLAIIGPNGAGKTTLINVISGVLKPSTGRIFLFGKEVTGISPYLRSRQGLSRTFQILSLFQASRCLRVYFLQGCPQGRISSLFSGRSGCSSIFLIPLRGCLNKWACGIKEK